MTPKRRVYVIGYPGSGKTTATRSVMEGLAFTVRDKPFKHTEYGDGTVQLGYEREHHGGTDCLSFNVQPKVIEWMNRATAQHVIGEGDRLANSKFFKAVQGQGWELSIVHFEVSELTALRRMDERGSAFEPAWVQGRITKTNNLANAWRGNITTVDGSMSKGSIAATLREILYEGGCT